jgi:lysozyme
MKTGIKGIELIKKFEGCKLTAYKCPAGIMTIGWGNTYYSNGAKVKVGDKITQQQADDLLLTLLPKYEKTVNNNIKVALTQNQFDALVSFCWNCGSSNTLFSKVNTNASDLHNFWTTHYITGGGKTLQGLVNRRKAESELYQLK